MGKQGRHTPGSSERWVARARPPRGRVGGYRKLEADEDIEPYLHDAARYPGGRCERVCLPTNEAEVADVLTHAASVLPVGAQSSLTGGATPHGGVVLSTESMAEIFSIEPDRARVGAGVILAPFLAQIGVHGHYYPPVPTYDGARIGGTVATNAAGAATFKYGTTRDWVHALTVVLASGDVLDLERGQTTARDDGLFEIELSDGRRIRLQRPDIVMPAVPKTSAGYFSRPGMDLIDLFIGAEGTLGVVTAVEVRLLREQPPVFIGLVPARDEAQALQFVAALRAASMETWRSGDPRGIDVAAIEYMDARSMELLAEDGTPARLAVPIPAATRAVVLFQAELPCHTSVSQCYDDLDALDDATRDSSLLRICRLLECMGLFESTLPVLPGDHAKREALFALREAVPEGVNRRITEAQRDRDPSISKSSSDVIVPFEHFSGSMRRYREIFARYGIDGAIWGHVSDGNVHPNAIPRTGDEMKRARQAQLDIGQVAIDLGGSPMSEHGVGRSAVKKELLRRLYGETGVASMHEIKRALDPRNILAPGVLFDA